MNTIWRITRISVIRRLTNRLVVTRRAPRKMAITEPAVESHDEQSPECCVMRAGNVVILTLIKKLKECARASGWRGTSRLNSHAAWDWRWLIPRQRWAYKWNSTTKTCKPLLSGSLQQVARKPLGLLRLDNWVKKKTRRELSIRLSWTEKDLSLQLLIG
jgi:hypothetical protein